MNEKQKNQWEKADHIYNSDRMNEWEKDGKKRGAIQLVYVPGIFSVLLLLLLLYLSFN